MLVALRYHGEALLLAAPDLILKESKIEILASDLSKSNDRAITIVIEKMDEFILTVLRLLHSDAVDYETLRKSREAAVLKLLERLQAAEDTLQEEAQASAKVSKPNPETLF